MKPIDFSQVKDRKRLNDVATKIIDAAMDMHRVTGYPITYCFFQITEITKSRVLNEEELSTVQLMTEAANRNWRKPK